MDLTPSDPRIRTGMPVRRPVGSLLKSIGRVLRIGSATNAGRNHSPASMKTIVRLVAKGIWSERENLHFEIVRHETCQKGLHSDPAQLTYRITLREGITAMIGSEVVLTSAEGESSRVGPGQAKAIRNAWQAVQAVGILNALGMRTETLMTPNAALTLLDERTCRIFESGDPPKSTESRQVVSSIERTEDGRVIREWAKEPSPWHELGNGVFFRTPFGISGMVDHYIQPNYDIMSETMGSIEMDGRMLSRCLRIRARSSFTRAFEGAEHRALPMTMPKGNAKADRIIRLCREAVARDPDLKDVNGASIRTLLNDHLPRLMSKHSHAAAIARTHEIADIDAALMHGLEHVRNAVERALAVSRSKNMDALRTELAFLEYRHPSPDNGLDQSTEDRRR